MRWILFLFLALPGCVSRLHQSAFYSGPHIVTATHFQGAEAVFVVPARPNFFGLNTAIVPGRVIRQTPQISILEAPAARAAVHYQLRLEPPRQDEKVWVHEAFSGLMHEASVESPDTLVLHSGRALPRGASGSPIVDDRGFVVGVVGGAILQGDAPARIFFYTVEDIIAAMGRRTL